MIDEDTKRRTDAMLKDMNKSKRKQLVAGAKAIIRQVNRGNATEVTKSQLDIYEYIVNWKENDS